MGCAKILPVLGVAGLLSMALPAEESFILSVVPESGGEGLPWEGSSRVLELTLPTGIQRIPCFVTLTSQDVPVNEGPQSWSLSITHDPRLSVGPSDVTVAGVHVSTIFYDQGISQPPLDPYDLELNDAGFKLAKPGQGGDRSMLPEGTEGVISAIVLHMTKKMTLHPNTTDTILKVTYEVEVVPGRNPDFKIQFEYGLSDGTCCAVANYITYQGFTYEAAREDGLILRLTGEGPWPRPVFVRGDANADGRVDMSDAIAILGFLYLGAPEELVCRKSADTDTTGTLNISDGITLLNHLFLGTADIGAPHPSCGMEPEPGELPCAEFPPCQ